MTAPAYTLAPTAWHPLPCGGRALLRAEYVRHYEHVPERRSKKATRTSADVGGLVSVGDLEARARRDGAPQLNAKERKRYAGNFGRQQARDAIVTGSSRGAEAQRLKFLGETERALLADPSLRRHGSRTLVSPTIERQRGKPSFRVRCDCGAESWAECGQWIRRAAPRACVTCANAARRGERHGARGIAAE